MRKVRRLIARAALIGALATGTGLGLSTLHRPTTASACTGWYPAIIVRPDSHGNNIYTLMFNQCTRQVRVDISNTPLCCVINAYLWQGGGGQWTEWTGGASPIGPGTIGPVSAGCNYSYHVDYDWVDTVNSNNSYTVGGPSANFVC